MTCNFGRPEIILVTSNQTRVLCSFDFEITQMFSDQIARQSFQLLLFFGRNTVFVALYSGGLYSGKFRGHHTVISIWYRLTSVGR